MTQAQQHLVNLLYFKKQVIKPFYEELDRAINKVLEENGMVQELEDSEGNPKMVHCFQDDNGVCYQIEPCKGKYIPFSPYEVHNTRTFGEEKGLAAKHPRVLGFDAVLDTEMAYSRKLEDMIHILAYVEA